MTDIVQKWAAAGTAISFTGLNSLTDGSTVTSDAIDLETVATLMDALIQGKFKTAAGTLGTNPVINIYAAAAVEDSANAHNYADTDNATLILSVVPGAADTVEYSNVRGLASAFGNVLPPRIKLVVENQTGLALAAADNAMWYQPTYWNGT